jgi:hypothetical protein
MIDFIQSKTKKIMYDCIKRYAVESGKDIEEIQLVLGLNESGNTYTICDKYQKVREYDFLQVLGVKIDFLGYSQIAPPFILKSLIRFSEKYNFPLENSKVMCIPTIDEKNKPDVLLFVYNENEYVDTITFKELFREEDIEIPI